MAIQYVVGICHVLMDAMYFMFMGKSPTSVGAVKGIDLCLDSFEVIKIQC